MAGEGKLCARYPCKNRGNVARAQDDIPSCSQASPSVFVSPDRGNETKFAIISISEGRENMKPTELRPFPLRLHNNRLIV